MLRFLGATARIEVEGVEKIEQAKQRWGSVVYCVWHGKILIPSYMMRGRGIAVIVSQHRDGQIAAEVLSSLGYYVIRGSSTRGGTGALARAISALKEGRDVVFVGDGPRGPYHRLKPGCIYAAAKTGKPVICASYAASPSKKLSSWDRFTLFPPFAKVLVKVSEPMIIPPGGEQELELWRQRVEKVLEELDREVEERCEKL